MKIELIGEEDIDNPIEFAERMTNEAIEIWNDNDWAKEINKNDVLVESKGVSGVFSESNILVMRSSGNIPVNDKKLFDFLT